MSGFSGGVLFLTFDTQTKIPFENQRKIADCLDCSLGSVNSSLKMLVEEQFLTNDFKITDQTRRMIQANSPKRAVILAAGSGVRMNPAGVNVPKGLLVLKEERLIERLICQLHEVGIYEIFIVVGYLKEKFEYLIDQYQVQLIVNPEYAVKNNLYSLFLADLHLENCYIMPADIYCKMNPFYTEEIYSWYMVSEEYTVRSNFRVNAKAEIISIKQDQEGNRDVGICYLTKESAIQVKKRMEELCRNWHYDNSFWEEALYENEKMIVYAKVSPKEEVIEINTYEQLKAINTNVTHLDVRAFSMIHEVLGLQVDEVKKIRLLKNGMTNRTFCFESQKGAFVLRIPAKETEQLISRADEALNYSKVNHLNYTADVLYINAKNGYKLSRYYEHARLCDPYNKQDLMSCIGILHKVHQSKIVVKHVYDIFEEIDRYEQMWGNISSLYDDYEQTKQKVYSLKAYIEEKKSELVFCHMDAVANNFLFVLNVETGLEEVHLIDWEYAAMSDPDMDIAMFGVQAMYDCEQMDALIDLYFDGSCEPDRRVKIYCYIAAAGLFWSNWCEYKRNQGAEFGEYSLKQYRYAKEYYRLAEKMLKEIGE